MIDWTKTLIEECCGLYNAGYSLRTLAALKELSPNAVISFFNRHPKYLSKRVRKGSGQKTRAAPKPPPEPIAPPDYGSTALIDLKEDMCRWPYGTEDFRFCGAAVEAKPYCPYHRSVAWQPHGSRSPWRPGVVSLPRSQPGSSAGHRTFACEAVARPPEPEC